MKEQLDTFYKEYLKISEKDIDKFVILVNKLINVNYLTAFKEEDKNDYYFINNYLNAFSNYFLLGGRELIHYPNQKTFVLNSPYSSKLSLNKINSLILLLLRLLYIEKMHDISLDNQVSITVGDLQAKFEQLAISQNDRLKIGELSESLRIFKKYNIIHYKGNDFQNDDVIITIYPTIQYAVSIDDIKLIVDKINSYKGKEEDNEEVEEN